MEEQPKKRQRPLYEWTDQHGKRWREIPDTPPDVTTAPEDDWVFRKGDETLTLGTANSQRWIPITKDLGQPNVYWWCSSRRPVPDGRWGPTNVMPGLRNDDLDAESQESAFRAGVSLWYS